MSSARRPSRGTAAMAITAGALILALLVARTPFFSALEWKVYDFQVRQAASADRPGQDIVTIDVDDVSIRRMAENRFGRFPWPRDAYAVVLEYLERQRPRAVAFDILFLEPDNATAEGQEADAALIEATRRLGNVIHASEVNDVRDSVPSLSVPGGYRVAVPLEEHRSVTLPFPGLAEASAAIGHTFTVLDADGPVRRSVPFVAQQGRIYPSLSMATAMVATGARPADVAVDATRLQVGGRSAPLIAVDQEYVDRIRTHHLLIPYSAPPYLDAERTTRSIPAYSFWDVFLSELQIRDGKPPQVDPAAFKDKIVLIGATAAGTHELFPTPFGDSGRMFGVHIHASVLGGLLDGGVVSEAPPSSVLAMMALAAASTGAAVVFLTFWPSLIVAALMSTAVIGTSAAAFRSGFWLAVIPSMLSIAFAMFAGVAYRYFVEDRSKREIRALFSRYVSPDVVAALVADPSRARLGGERRVMTVLFADIRGFTTLSESGNAEDVLNQLNEFFTHMVDLLFLHKGTLDKFVGDMIMALFSAPLVDPDHADNAVRMAIAMREELARLNRKWVAERRPELDIGIGISTGEMIVGNVGSERTLSYTVIGDNVNLGARLESLNKEFGTHIIISDATLKQLKGRYRVRPLGSVKVKGKNQEIEIHEVAGHDTPAA